MKFSWNEAAQNAACGVIGLAVVLIARFVLKRRPFITLPSTLTVFLTCVLGPAVWVFAIYPFVEPKPNLENHGVYLLVAAFAMAWAIVEVIRQSIK